MNKLYHAAWQSPSNIALVKYWGKKPVQIPANASISFTLSKCHTNTKLTALEKQGNPPQVLLNGIEAPGFVAKTVDFFQRVSSLCPAAQQFDWLIETENTFPHSSGIASSASGMSALALCLADIAEQNGQQFQNKMMVASEMARLGSGSACRSVYGPVTIWGQHPMYDGSSDRFAVPLTEIHPVFTTYRDTILIVHAGEKSVSSTKGHDLINGHPFATARFSWANQQAAKLKSILKSGALDDFNDLVESEALMLHALMLSSTPGFILMKPETLAIIEKIRAYRKQKNNSFVFTLDAGANVHFLYSEADENQALDFIKNELVGLCDNGKYICDKVGTGPKPI